MRIARTNLIPEKWFMGCLLAGCLFLSPGVITAAGISVVSHPVAVLDFKLENPTAYTGERVAGLADFFEMALQKKEVPVLERRNIRLALAERDLQADHFPSAEKLADSKLPRVEYFIGGSVAFPRDSRFSLTISIIKADTATMEFTSTRSGAYPDDWLPVIQSLADAVNLRLQLQLPPRKETERSEFEMITWLPEAALPFFKGLDYFSGGDYAGAVPWFRHSYEKDRHFDLARRWEARAYNRLNLPQLAKAWSDAETNGIQNSINPMRPVAAVSASAGVSIAGRAAFSQALAQSHQFELFDPASIGATAREIDLQLTGQMAAPLNDRSVWLIVDELIYLDAPDAETLSVRQQNLMSGEIVRRAKVRGRNGDEAGFHSLAQALLEVKKPMTATPEDGSRQAPPEPRRSEPGETALPKALRLVQLVPDNARYWVGLADIFGDERFRGICLDEAVKAIDRKREQTDAAYWLASALWRKREMSRRIFYAPTAQHRAPNSLTNDFARLLQWFPNSAEIASLREVTNGGEGSFTWVGPADRRYLAAVYTSTVSPPLKTSGTPVAPRKAAKLDEAGQFARLQQYLRNGRTAPAWQLANELRRLGDESLQAQVQADYDRLLQTVIRERQQFHEFNSAANDGNSQRVMQLGHELLKCANRQHRTEVIWKCSSVLKQSGSPSAQLKFLFAQARQYREDFLEDPAPGVMGGRFEYQLVENSNLVQPVTGGADYGYEPLMGAVAELVHDLPPSNLIREILEYIHDDPVLPLEKRLTAAYDLALIEQAHGNTFEALDQLQEVLRQTEGSGLPLKRNTSWSQSIETAAFATLRKIRVYANAELDICDCCGKVPGEPPQEPANFQETNRRLGQLWKQQIGEAGANLPPVKQQLLAEKESFLPTILYKLRVGQEVSHMLLFCADLGTNALSALPVILQIIHRGEPFEDYNNALSAVGAIGPAAGCARPLLIMARENADNGNFNYAFRRTSSTPRQVMPLLAQLLYHKSPTICAAAAREAIQTAHLDPKQFEPGSTAELVVRVRQWWETAGSAQVWK